MSKKVVVKPKTKKSTTATKTTAKKSASKVKSKYPTGVPVNVKVDGERAMRKNVVLEPSGKKGEYKVLTGKRGRPGLLTDDVIEKVRKL